MQLCQPSFETLETTDPQAMEKLSRTWNNGALAHHAALLNNFVLQRHEDIFALAGWNPDAPALILALKTLVVVEGTVHHPTEMRDQLREIHNDIWYHGQRGDYDRRRIACEWPVKHGAKWRRWRIAEYLFVIDCTADDLVARLRQTDLASGPQSALDLTTRRGPAPQPPGLDD